MGYWIVVDLEAEKSWVCEDRAAAVYKMNKRIKKYVGFDDKPHVYIIPFDIPKED